MIQVLQKLRDTHCIAKLENTMQAGAHIAEASKQTGEVETHSVKAETHFQSHTRQAQEYFRVLPSVLNTIPQP